MDKQTGKLIARIAENLPDIDRDIMQGWIDNPKGLQKFLQGLRPPEAALPSCDETIVRVDRSVRPVYPDGTTPVHSELETAGPAEYDLAKQVELWFHDEQKVSGLMSGTVIYNHLIRTNTLKTCLGLHDVVAIQQKGVNVFRKLFGRNLVFCWKSVVRKCDNNHLCVPYIYSDCDEVGVCWDWLAREWDRYRPAARFVR